MSDASAANSSPSRRTVVLALSGLVCLMAILCLPTLHTGLWEDELIQIDSASQPNILAVWQNMYGRMTDLHPPLSYVLLYPILKIFGANEIAVRMPFLVCGLLLVPTMYWLGCTAHSRKAGLLAAFFAAVSPFENYFACQSRSYSLSTLLVAVSLAFFCQLVIKENRARIFAFVGFVIAATAVYYTEYSAGVLLPALAEATVLISWRYSRTAETKPLAISLLKYGFAAIILSALLILPWVPSLLKQKPHDQMIAPPPLAAWPLVFGYNLVMMMPLPAVVGIILECWIVLSTLARPIIHGVRAILREDLKEPSPAGDERLDNLPQHPQPHTHPPANGAFALFSHAVASTVKKDYLQFRVTALSLPPTQIVLVCALLIPCSLIGYIIQFYLGYYRYVFSYAPAGWAVYAILTCGFGSKMSKRSVVIILLLMLGVNIAWISHFDSVPQSAIRTLAEDAEKGDFDNTVIVLVSDIELGPSLNHFLPESERKAHNILVVGYPRWSDPFSIITVPEIPPAFQSVDLLAEVESNIKALPEQGKWKYLALVSELDQQIQLVTTKGVPRMQRITALRNFMDTNFQKVKSKHPEYAGITESVTVNTYSLGPK